jgi:sugar (pentulose or hexulose) kinase
VGLGLHPDFETAIREMTHPGKTFEPDPAAHEIYDRLYRKVYLRIYDQLKPLYEEFGDIPDPGK